MSIEGDITVRIDVRDGAVAAVGIDSTRPAVAGRVLSGKSVGDAVALVPRLYSICGRAQAVAAQLAATACAESTPRADTMSTQHVAALEPALYAEVAFDTLWRALIDWRRALGTEPDADTLARVRGALANNDRTALRAVIERELLGEACESWLDADLLALERWLDAARTPAAQLLCAVFQDNPRQGASVTPLLPSFANEATFETVTASLFLDPQFERAPHWAGKAAETGALARAQHVPRVAAAIRAYGHGTLTRLVARLTELARIVIGRGFGTPIAGRRALGDGRGLGWVETARGAVLHLIECADGGRNVGDTARVARYRIVAPTEWNFHPCGALAAGLRGLSVTNEAQLRRRASWLIGALDPCVAWRLEIGHA